MLEDCLLVLTIVECGAARSLTLAARIPLPGDKIRAANVSERAASFRARRYDLLIGVQIGCVGRLSSRVKRRRPEGKASALQFQSVTGIIS